MKTDLYEINFLVKLEDYLHLFDNVEEFEFILDKEKTQSTETEIAISAIFDFKQQNSIYVYESVINSDQVYSDLEEEIIEDFFYNMKYYDSEFIIVSNKKPIGISERSQITKLETNFRYLNDEEYLEKLNNLIEKTKI